MKYFTKEWYEACQAADWCLNMAVSKNAQRQHALFLQIRLVDTCKALCQYDTYPLLTLIF